MAETLDGLCGDLASRVVELLRDTQRVVIGIAGPPGAGKTTIADALAEKLRSDFSRIADPSAASDWVARVPMDGFHLADAELERLGRLQRKGAPDTFDVAGYAALLRRLHDDHDDVVYAPSFDRHVEQPIAGSIAVSREARVIITEGNYLLSDGSWARVRPLFTQVWFIEIPEDERHRRLIARHEKFGKSPQLAWAWAHGVDERNASFVAATSHRANLIIALDDEVPNSTAWRIQPLRNFASG